MTDKTVAMAVEVIIDNSGSMCRCAAHVVDGLNEFIEQLSTAFIPCQLGITLFDDKLKKSLVNGVLVNKVPRISYDDYQPDHRTENIAYSVIQGLEERLAPINARQKALIVVTDGQNHSPQMAAAKKLILQRQKEGWLILWMGVYNGGYDGAIPVLNAYAKGLGIPEAVTFAFADMNLDKGMPAAARATLQFGAVGDASKVAFTAKDRASIK